MRFRYLLEIGMRDRGNFAPASGYDLMVELLEDEEELLELPETLPKLI